MATKTGNAISLDDDSTSSASVDVLEPQLCDIDPHELSPFTINSTGYMAGWIIRRILQKLDCDEYRFALLATPEEKMDSDLALLRLRDNGGLVYPSRGVRRLVAVTERVVKATSFADTTVEKVQSSVILYFSTDLLTLFPVEHLSGGDETFDSHLLLLVRNIIKAYVNLRQFSKAKSLSLDLTKSRIRHVLNKRILLSGQ